MNLSTRSRLFVCGLCVALLSILLWVVSVWSDVPSDPVPGGTPESANGITPTPHETAGGSAVPAAAGEVRSEQSDDTIHIRVERATDNGPVAARLLFLDQFGRRLDECTTDAEGEFSLPRTGRRVPYGVVAFDPRHQLCGARIRGSRVLLRMKRLEYVRAEVRVRHDVTREILEDCNRVLKMTYRSNPVRAGASFLEAKAFELWGLNRYEVPMSGLRVDLPRYVHLAGDLRFNAEYPHERRLITWPRRRGGGASLRPERTLVLEFRKRLAPDESEAVIRLHETPHALIAHFSRREGHAGRVFLSLQSASGRSVIADDTFRQRASLLTFGVFRLAKGRYRPTIVFEDDHGTLRPLECAPVEVDGRTEVHLQPVAHADLTVTLRGPLEGAVSGHKRAVAPPVVRQARWQSSDPQPKAVEAWDPERPVVTLFDAKMRRVELPVERDRSGRKHRFVGLPPHRYYLLARTAGRVSGLELVDLRSGRSKTVVLDLAPVCRVDFRILDEKFDIGWVSYQRAGESQKRTLSFQNHTLYRSNDRVFGRGHVLDLPRGRYSFVVRTPRGRHELAVDLAAARKTIGVGAASAPR